MPFTPAQRALGGYMEGQSEARWCAGWLTNLHHALLGDPAYEWLVTQAGGWFTYYDGTEDRSEFVEGTLTALYASDPR